MEAIENAAYISVGRGCGFAGLAVFITMAGLSFDPVLATRMGGFGCLIITGFLVLNGLRARKRPYKRTETWIILPKDKRPPETIAQRVVGETLRETYMWFAYQAALISACIWATVLALQIADVQPLFEVPERRS